MWRTGTRGRRGRRLLRGRSQPPAPARVLVADDDAVIRELIAVYLRVAGFEVAMACDGQDALDQARRSRPDVVVLDASMPRADGRQVAARLRARPATASIRTVLLTQGGADDGEADGEAAGLAGVDACIAMPFDPDDLIGAVRRLAGPP
jgi:CheY-like chemotaxis protein